MASERVGDMTLDELKEIIIETVVKWQGEEKSPAKRSVEELVAHIRQHRWTPPPGSPTNQELLREDRDR